MHDISDLNREGLPSNKTLVKASFSAFLLASILLVTTILPAEYGIDPTGLGSSMGLTAMATVSAATSEETFTNATGPVWKRNTPYRTDTMTLTLFPSQGAEIKAIMKAGENFVFNWEVKGGSVSFDMHGEPLNAVGDEFTSYWLGQDESRSSGSFEAPFDGTHGWYWQNKGSKPVEVHLATSGFYTELYTP